jgi:hypothetical protein
MKQRSGNRVVTVTGVVAVLLGAGSALAERNDTLGNQPFEFSTRNVLMLAEGDDAAGDVTKGSSDQVVDDSHLDHSTSELALHDDRDSKQEHEHGSRDHDSVVEHADHEGHPERSEHEEHPGHHENDRD